MSPHASTARLHRPMDAAARHAPSVHFIEERYCAALEDADSPEVHAQLEELDDAMFAAIAGNRGALEKARELWFHALAGLPLALVEESREQYLRYAAEVIRRAESDAPHIAAAAAFEVAELLARDQSAA